MYHRKKNSRRLTDIGKRFLASLISLCMLVSFAPAAIAEGIELTENIITDVIPEIAETEEKAVALSEITEMRDEFSKTFLMSDGTYTQVTYASPVHYETEDGTFCEIDNRLSVNAMTGKITTGEGGTNAAFSQTQPEVSINANGHSISWSVEKKNELRNDDNASLMSMRPAYQSFTANAINTADTSDFMALPAEEQLMSAHKAFSELKYVSLEEGYGVNYTVAPGKIKEDILITSAENNEFVITVDAMGLTAVLGDYRTVIFKNNANETVLTFDVPYMYAANDEFSTDIDISLTKIIGGYEITLTASEEWLESEDRVYPVVINPVYTVSGESNVVDTSAHCTGASGTCTCQPNHSIAPNMLVGTEGEAASYGLIKFNTLTGYGLSKIISATITLTASGSNLSLNETFSLQRIKFTDWDENISYNTADSLGCANPNERTSLTINSNGSCTATYDIREDVIGMLVGEYENHGYRLSYTGGFISVASSESTTASSCPVLTIEYVMDTPAGTHYFNNVSEYKFLAGAHYNSHAYTGKYDVASNADNEKLLWEITNISYYSGYTYICTAKDEENGNEYALYSDSQSHARVGILDTTDDKFKWNIIEYSEGEYVIVNKADNTRLLMYNGELYSAFEYVSDTSHWRMMTEDEYNPRTTLSMEDMYLEMGDTVSFSALRPTVNGTVSSSSTATFAQSINSYTLTEYGSAVTMYNDSFKVTDYGASTLTLGCKDTTATATFYVLVSEFPGTYFIKNVGSGKYMDTSNDSGRIHAKQYGFDREPTQMWQFEIQTDGSYMIKNVATETYLTITSLSGNYPAILRERSAEIIEEQRFDIEKDTDGNVTIYPHHGKATNAILGAQTTSSGAYIGEGSATADNRDLWQIRTGNVYIEFSMDQGYVTRNQRENESREETAERISDVIIYNYFDYVRDAFAEQCGVYLELADEEVLLYTSAADNCPTDVGIDGNCQCVLDIDCALNEWESPYENNSFAGPEYNCHCKSMALLRNNLIIGIPANTIRVTYTGHQTCYYSGNEKIHYYNCPWGMSDFDYPIVGIKGSKVQEIADIIDSEITELNPEKNYEGRNSVLLLVHELSHTYGANHHEHIEGQPCVMSDAKFYETRLNDNSSYWCDSCKATINSNFNKY